MAHRTTIASATIGILIFFTAVFYGPSVPAKEIAGTKHPVVTFVELGSVSCVPCKMMQPVMEAIENEYAGSVKVVFHDVWKPEGKPFAKKYGIRAIPTQIFFDKDGNEFFRHTGFYPKDDIVKMLAEHGVTKGSLEPARPSSAGPSPDGACGVGSVCK